MKFELTVCRRAEAWKVVIRDCAAEEAHSAHLLHDFKIECFLVVSVLHARHEALLRVGSGSVLDVSFILREKVIEIEWVLEVELLESGARGELS